MNGLPPDQSLAPVTVQRPKLDPRGAPLAICALLALAYAAQQWFNLTDAWALSLSAIRAGHPETLLLSMIGHTGLLHLGFNLLALAALGGEYALRVGRSARATTVLIAVLFIGGIIGGLFYIAIESRHAALGFSGAICALWGLNARLTPIPGRVWRMTAPPVLAVLRQFAVMNVLVLVMLELTGGGLAWQAHLGGFALGFLAAPAVARYLARP